MVQADQAQAQESPTGPDDRAPDRAGLVDPAPEIVCQATNPYINCPVAIKNTITMGIIITISIIIGIAPIG